MAHARTRLSHTEIAKIRSGGRRLHSAHLLLHYIYSQHLPKAAGFVVSKRIANTAPNRNKLKRRGRYAFQKLTKNNYSHLRALFMLKPQSASLTYQQFEAEMRNLLKGVVK